MSSIYQLHCGDYENCSAGVNWADVSHQFFERGIVCFKNAFEPAFIDQLRKSFCKHNLSRINDPNYPYRVGSLGDRRSHVIIELFRDFNSPRFYANPWLYRFMLEVLGEGFIVPGFAASVAFPRAQEQYTHRDQPLLYRDVELNRQLPACSITVSIPLIDVDEQCGSTEHVLASHRPTDPNLLDDKVESGEFHFTPVYADKGDCILWDSRLLHRGMKNQTRYVRPIILLYYQKPWFINYPSVTKGMLLPITDKELEKVPEQYAHLFKGVCDIANKPVFEAEADEPCPCGSRLKYDQCHGS